MGFFEWLFEPLEDVVRSIRDIWKENDSVEDEQGIHKDENKEQQ